MKPLFVEFYASSRTGLRAQATAAVNEAKRRGSTTLVVGLDSLATLDDAAISATIVALRGLRETGGTVRLVTQSVTHRQHLKAMGLDRIFAIFASFEEAAQPDERAVSRVRAVATAAFDFFVRTLRSMMPSSAKTPKPSNKPSNRNNWRRVS
jgi:anti-anti-sigma regulatory factor